MATETRPARRSSTVVLVRDAVNAPEIFMVRRHRKSSFGASYAFPGGVLERSDHGVHDLCAGVSSAVADRLLGVDGIGLDYFSCAIRELFEEAGVLLGQTQRSNDELGDVRKQLNDGSLSWDRFAADNKLVLHCDQLQYFSYWITPESEPKRYSTRFFLAEMPAGQHAYHDGGELIESCWMSAEAVLQACKKGEMTLIYPTRKTLERIAQLESTSALREWARSCGEAGVVCNQPAFAPASVQ